MTDLTMASPSMASPPGPTRPSSSTASSSSPPTVSYESFAPRSSAQIARLSRLAALTAGPTASVDKGDSVPEFTLVQAMTPPPTPTRGSYPGSNMNASDDSVQETLAKTNQTSDRLSTTLKHTTSVKLALRASINIAEDISNRHAELLRHSGELSAAADRLQAEEEMMTKRAEEIGMPLKHYDAVDRIGLLVGVLFKNHAVVRGLAKIKVDNDDFPAILEEIDNAVDFFGQESGGKEALQAELRRRSADKTSSGQLLSGSVEYYRRSLALQDAALFLIREAVVVRITQTTKDIAASLDIPKVPIAADKLEASLVYTRYHGISSRSNRLLMLVRKRLDRGDAYHELLQLCRNTYCSCRESLLKMSIRAHMDKLKGQHGIVGMTRLASVFLIRLCTVETTLYLDFFGEKDEANGKDVRTQSTSASLATQVVLDDGTFRDSEFQTYLSNLSAALHRTVRRGLVTVLDLDTLCQIVSVLREERSMASASPTTMAAARAISSVIEDAQERLIFCANTALTKEVVRFKATPGDLDYPNKLTPAKTSDGVNESKVEGSATDAIQQQLQVYETWFPPMRSVLRILSKIFRVVEPRVFEDIALDCVQACTRCLKDGATYILKKNGVIHADLFLVKHLLILREQLSPFDIELRAVERQLDFSDAGKAVSRFLANRNRQLFSMSTENALVTLLREGVSVQESAVDSKRDLEDALRSACNDFIEHTSSSLARPMLGFVEQCKACNSELQQQAFMSFDSVKSVIEQTAEGLDDKWSDVRAQMGLYLDNTATQSILLKPVIRKIIRALEETHRFASQVPDDVNSWDPIVRSGLLKQLEEIEKTIKKGSSTSNKPGSSD